MKRYFYYIIALFFVFSCAEDIIDLTGSIEGFVKDDTTNDGLQGVSITLSPSGKTTTTGSDGHYSFTNIDANNYSIEFAKAGYEANKKEITILSGKKVPLDIMMKKISNALITTPETLNFGELETSKNIFISCIKNLDNIRYTINANADWISLSAIEGNASSTGEKITVVIDRSKLSIGNYEKKITISSLYGEVIIPVVVNQVEHDKATVTTDSPNNITETSLTIKGTIIKTGGLKITSHGHCWSEKENPTIDNYKNNLGDIETIGDFTSTLTNLVAGKTYYIKSYAVNSKGVAYSEQVSVTIPIINKPTVSTQSISELRKDSVCLNGKVLDKGNGTINQYGFYWGLTEKTENKQQAEIVVDSMFSYILKPLQPNKIYYYKAFAINEKGESVGDIKTFTSLDKNAIEGVPVVQTNEALEITTNTALLKGALLNSGNSKIIQLGFYYGESESTLIKKSVNITDSIFTLNVTSLKDETTYYFKAFAINDKGESIGKTKTFITKGVGLPVVLTSDATKIETNSATLNGFIANQEGCGITKCGFYYGESINAMIKKESNITDSIISLDVTNLTDGTTYYYKVFATNQKGETCGDIKEFKTNIAKAPEVQTLGATDINIEAATLNGEIISNGDYEITQRGFYFGESKDAMTKKVVSTTNNTISLNVTSLTDGTTYYYKVFATNQKGETCGDIKEFKTNIAKAPEVQTLGATDINIEAATLNGEIISNGDYEITQRGFYFGESKDAMTKKVVSTTNNTISLNVTSLTDGTTYYYKVFATNQKGESCGDIREFKTINGVLPMIITDNATAVSYEQATLNGSILDYGSFDIIECGFYYGTDENYMTKVVAVKYDDNFNITINNLTDNTTYYYKAYVKTKKGEELGYTVVFSTLDDSIIQPWDGTIASSFAGGSGTFIDPYLINTPSQLAYITKESGAYYKLIKDLDLDNRPWKPITLNGNFDGNGKTISNLYINRNQDRVGLFESASGKICNLTISNVNIKIPTCSEIGALAGYSYGCEFDNCHVILTNSCITGNQDIGGLVGHVRCSAKSNNTFKNCSIISQSDNFVINGNRYVGGICGLFSYDQDKYISAYISNCHVKANILAQSDLGGLFGAVSLNNFNIEKCSYNGNVTGEKYLGGMIGSISYNVYFISSKTTIKINANGYAGGFVGLSSGDTYDDSKISIVSCYTNIDLTNSTGKSGGFVGYINMDRDAYFSCCYSLITANNSSTNNIQGFVGSRYSDSKSYTIDCATAYSKGIWEGENSILNCKNQELIEHLQYSGSEYLINWNFNNTWTWTGVVDGVSKSVVCPRLSWE